MHNRHMRQQFQQKECQRGRMTATRWKEEEEVVVVVVVVEKEGKTREWE